MLSTQAFNGLLKTLEEPPEHVKFIFATTEIRKVPITVLSRCQRFDLRRISASDLVGLFSTILGKEGVPFDPEALAMVARAAEGSARDGLSLLDQAIAHGGGSVEIETVRSMLGLADRARIVDLFEHVIKGDVAGALDEFAAQYEAGANPTVVLTDLADFTHLVTRLKYVPDAVNDQSLSEIERTRGAEFAGSVAVTTLSRVWQMLLKGIPRRRALRARRCCRDGADQARPCRPSAFARRGRAAASRSFGRRRRRSPGPERRWWRRRCAGACRHPRRGSRRGDGSLASKR